MRSSPGLPWHDVAAPLTRFIAEVGSNHNGDLSRALALIQCAADIGCWGVKFQLWRLDRLYAPEALARQPELEARRALELPEPWLPRLTEQAQRCRLAFGVTPCDLDAVACLATLGPALSFAKVASYSLLDHNLLHGVAGLDVPLVVSTGMATDEELLNAWIYLARPHPDITWLHCVSAYPCPPSWCHLERISHLRGLLSRAHSYGWSDHSCHALVVLTAALRFQCDLIECHLDLEDRRGTEAPHSWTPDALRAVIRDVADAQAIGDTPRHWYDIHERAWRADPADGLRPTRALRQQWALLQQPES